MPRNEIDRRAKEVCELLNGLPVADVIEILSAASANLGGFVNNAMRDISFVIGVDVAAATDQPPS